MNISKVLGLRILEVKLLFFTTVKTAWIFKSLDLYKNNVYRDAKIEYQKTFFKFNLGNFDLII